MENFDLESHLQGVYSAFPEAKHRPLIGLTANYEGIDATLRERYYKQVVEAGGVPVIVPPVADTAVIINTLQQLDGLILTGGGDHNPLWMGEEPSPRLHNINRERDLAELLLVRLAFNRQIPMLGICRGIQTLAIALGGKVEQDIEQQVKHSQDADRSEPTHSVCLVKDSTLYNIYGSERIMVNSFHHQAVSQPGKRFRVIARSADNIIEAIESSEYKSILGVQWHPEWLEAEGQKIFRWLVERADEFYAAKQFHARNLTLDTHCDTPMFFPQGVRFDHRDSRILVDLHKMTDGRQDATTMVAYLPQPKPGESFSSKVEFDVETPVQYADLIFDKIGDIVAQNSDYLAFARTPAQLYANKQSGRKSIMLGIENGLAIHHDLANVEHFAQRGIVYITLCHNGDNDICDSARGSNTHHGVSDFGEQVIREMNRLGLMVDLSHASEKSFYDALQISSTPIVCSHSSCRALCDVPRNLTDDQLRALAACGGVAQVTLYHGFLRKDGETYYAKAVAVPFAEHYKNLPQEEKPILMTEPGTTVINSYIDFIGKVESIKHIKGREFVVLNCSKDNLGDICKMKKMPLQIVHVNEQQEMLNEAEFVGYTCLEHDVMYPDYKGSLGVGDYVIFGNVGGYSNVSKPPFIFWNCPMIGQKADGSCYVMKKGETFEDVFTTYVI